MQSIIHFWIDFDLNHIISVHWCENLIWSYIKAKGICLTDEVKDELDFNIGKNFAEEYQRGNISTKKVQQQ
jgi:hypothetical protein